MEYNPINFPIDEGKHDSITEWWYLNGILNSKKDKQRFAYMSTLFRVKYPTILGGIFSFLPSHDAYVYHSIITDLTNKKYYPNIEIVTISDDIFRDNNLSVKFVGRKSKNDYSLLRENNNVYSTSGPNFNLILGRTKPPILIGETGFVDNVGEQTYYYSLSSLKTTGKLEIDNEVFEIFGNSWMDHQWGDFRAPKGYWNWFSVQLENNIEVICYESGSKKGSKTLATISYSDGSQKSYSTVIISPNNKQWLSPKTGANYPLSWKVDIPEANLFLEIDSLVDDHEMTFWYINYWEGPSKVTAKFCGKQIYGQGFIELVGRHSKIHNHGPIVSFLLGQIVKNDYS